MFSVYENTSGTPTAIRGCPLGATEDLAGIDPIVLLRGCSDGAQHQRMRYLHLLRVWK
jgi:hypothetical protein